MTHSEQMSLLATNSEQQFRLVRLQTLNWGTFSGLCDIAIPTAGYLFVGPSGSGKSTLLDAHTALLTPPRWVDFNVAAREAEKTGRDRSLVSYVRGAWSQQTAENGEYNLQYLRPGTTWSAIAETYRNDDVTVVLAQLLWVRGSSCGTSDIRRLYLVLQRDLDLRSLEFFPESDFDVRRLKTQLPDALVKEEFSAYQERFRHLLGIESESALRLLHKTQSAKNLGDLNVFLRDFMLDPPATFETADRLVAEFGELNAAHQAVVAARQQIETLAPARKNHSDLLARQAAKASLDELARNVDAYCEQRRADLLAERVAEIETALEGLRQELLLLGEVTRTEFSALTMLRSKRDGLAGGVALLSEQLSAAKVDLAARQEASVRAKSACAALGLVWPAGPAGFVEIVADVRTRLAEAREVAAGIEAQADQFKRQRELKVGEFQEVRSEIEAMERQRSSIPSHMLRLRERIASETGLDTADLPFAGELIEVQEGAAEWRGGIERVLRPLALSILVDERRYAALSTFVDEHELGERLVYNRMQEHEERRAPPRPNSLVHKLKTADAPQAAWLRRELLARYDYECAATMAAFRASPRALTRQGQIKHSPTRHEKDDRFRVGDRRNWILGFDNREKLKHFKELGAVLGGEIVQFDEQLREFAARAEEHRTGQLHSQTLVNLRWAEVDVGSMIDRVARIEEQLVIEREGVPELETLETEIAAQQKRHEDASGHEGEMRAEKLALERDREKLLRQRARLSPADLSASLSPEHAVSIEARCNATNQSVTLESLDPVIKEVDRGIRQESQQHGVQIALLRGEIEKQFEHFNRSWPAESSGLDAKLESAPDYLRKLARLETDGLPRFEERFMRLLHEQSDQNLSLLSARLDHERTAIHGRLELVNESLAATPYSPGTHLFIVSRDLALEEVRKFKQELKAALSHAYSEDKSQAEGRFLVLSDLVRRLGSQETVHRNWRSLVLDVRLHVEFVARELDDNQNEVEVYRSGAGKSGGQRQKLAATCLAAALRYQLGGRDRALPSFATVVLDEAFDKADSEFTAMAMKIFESCGFQMIVATPLKSVMTLEPFIGGACFVHIRDRKISSSLIIEYDTNEKRLKLPEHTRDATEAASS